MNNLIVIIACIAVTAYGQCPPGNCPPPVFPSACQVPNCNLLGNRYDPRALFPHEDPNYFWQCAPINATHWAAMPRLCACGSVFNPFVDPPRCTTHLPQDNWAVPVGCPWQNPPIYRNCPPWCPECGGTPGTTTTTTLPPPGNPVTPAPPGGNPPGTCPCPCPPCIWWPCVPCHPTNTCPCSG